MRKQYHFRPSQNGFLAWDVDKLILRSESLPTLKYPIAKIAEKQQNYWYQAGEDIPTVRSIIAHMELVERADLKYLVLIGHDGSLMDGMHRVVKAVMKKETHILAKKFETVVPPDYVDVHPDELAY